MKEKVNITYIQKLIYTIALSFFILMSMDICVSASNSNNWAWPTESQTIKDDWPRYSSGKYHSGTDFAVAENTPVYSTCDGKVVTVKSMTTSYGKYIKVEAVVEGKTVYMRYCHLNRYIVSEGDLVKSGQLIGYSGSTGNSTGPHLHYEVRNADDSYGNVNNPTLDPRYYLPGSSYDFTCNEDEDETETTQKRDNVSRDIVLVLDRSGSMYGDPMDQTKQAAVKFVDTVFEQDARVSVVSYDSYAAVECNLTDNQQELTSCIENLYTDGSTNMYGGLEQADNILTSSQADRKIIVLMSDGLPNEGVQDNGDYSAALLRYAEDMKNRGYYIYTLGFFSAVDGGERYSAQQLMEGIASPGLHYEVNSADDLVFFFGDIADQISGTRYVYIRIACPVDVTVTSHGETLSSKTDSENTRTSFGALTYESVQAETEDVAETDYNSIYDAYYYEDTEVLPQDRVKVLRLNMDEDYDVEIEGYDTGTMDYSVSFPNEKGEYDDVRKFPNIAVTSSTKAVSNTGESDATYLEVDEDGDGKIDATYKAKANGKMEEVKDNKILFIVLIAMIVAIVLILIVIIVLLCVSAKKKKAVHGNGQGTRRAVGNIYGAFGIFGGQSYPMCLGQQCVVGRKSNCDIQLVHGQVSRVHCVIEMLPDGVYQVTDYSSNGTFYNNQRLKSREPYRLPKGALLAIGDADNVLELR